MSEPKELCADCGHEKDDSRFHHDAPGTNWGAALHWFKPKAESGPMRSEVGGGGALGEEK